jgi:outer membrane protein TolC
LTADVRSGYWDLFLAREHLGVTRQLSEGARRVLDLVTARVEMGVESQTQVLQAEVGVARREEDIVIAEDAVHDAEDRLKSLMGLDRDPGGWRTRLELVDRPGTAPFSENLDAAVERALQIHPTMGQVEMDLRDSDLRMALARDGMRPAVDLNLRAGISGIGSSYGDNWSVLTKAEGRSWQGGVTLDIPLGSTLAGERYRQTLVDRERADLAAEQTRLSVARQVREHYRQVKTNAKRTEVTRLAKRLAEQSVAEEEERLSLGLATVRDVLDAQDDLATSQVSHLRAVVDYNKALAEWERLTGE